MPLSLAFTDEATPLDSHQAAEQRGAWSFKDLVQCHIEYWWETRLRARLPGPDLTLPLAPPPWHWPQPSPLCETPFDTLSLFFFFFFLGEFPGGLVVRIWHTEHCGPGLIPGLENEIPHQAAGHCG